MNTEKRVMLHAGFPQVFTGPIADHVETNQVLDVVVLEEKYEKDIIAIADNIFKLIFLNGNCSILNQISLKVIPKVPLNNIPALVQIMAWHQTGDTYHYRQFSNIRRTLVGNKIVDHSDVVGATPVGAAPTTSSFST